MFQERNEGLLKPNENEYFFDRNGKAFHYIMEYYRTGKILWTEMNNFITKQELQIEMDFFQISYELPSLLPYRKSFPPRQEILKLLQDFIEALKSCIGETSWNLKDEIRLTFAFEPKYDSVFQSGP